VCGALLAALVAAGGCAQRKDVLLSRLREIPDARAHQVVGDALWVHGSFFAWATHENLRMEVTWTEHRPDGDVASDEIWLLDLAGGRFRVERPAEKQVTVYDGSTWRVFVDGKPSDDLVLRGRAAGYALLVREIVPLPFSLLDPGVKIEYVGTRTGPAEARTWNRLLVTYPPSSGLDRSDRTVVEVEKESRRVSRVLGCWAEPPFMGSCWRVDADEAWETQGIALGHRWRFTPVNDAGAPTGPMRWTLAVKSMIFDVWLGADVFSRP
jgi:hypothetical protein